MMPYLQECVLCNADGGMLVASTDRWRVIRALDQEGFPLTYRVIWNAHVAEFSYLSQDERRECMAAVAWVEQAMRRFLQPQKINLAAFGNMVPHLHWHLVARYPWDSRFPASPWAVPVRENPVERWEALLPQQQQLEQYLCDHVALAHGY